jgi:hypothetical protein
VSLKGLAFGVYYIRSIRLSKQAKQKPQGTPWKVENKNKTKGGALKKKNRTPTYTCRAHPKSPHPPPSPPPPDLLFYCISRRFSASGVQKHQKNLKKSMSKMFYKKMRKITFPFFLGEREPLNGLILIEATYRNGIHGSH